MKLKKQNNACGHIGSSLLAGRGTFLASPGSVNCERKVEWTLTP